MCTLGKLCSTRTGGIERVTFAHQVIAVEVGFEIRLIANLPCSTGSIHIVAMVKVITVCLFFGKDCVLAAIGILFCRAFEITGHLRPVGPVVVIAAFQI